MTARLNIIFVMELARLAALLALCYAACPVQSAQQPEAVRTKPQPAATVWLRQCCRTCAVGQETVFALLLGDNIMTGIYYVCSIYVYMLYV